MRDGDLKVVSRRDDMVEVSGTLPTGSECRAWLKPSLGYLAVKTKLVHGPTESDSETVVDRWVQIKNSFFPVGGTAVHHEAKGGERTITMKVSVSDLKFGEVTPKDFETPPLTPGSTIKDDVGGQMWEIGPNGEKIYRGAVNGVSTVKAGVAGIYGWLLILAVTGILSGLLFYRVRRS